MAENSTLPAKKRPRGRPFQKGQSGNPGGRPPSLASLVREKTGGGLGLVNGFLSIWEGRASYSVGEEDDERKVVPGWKERIEAGKWLGAYGFGPPVQTLRHEGEDGGPLQVAISITRTVKKPEGD